MPIAAGQGQAEIRKLGAKNFGDMVQQQMTDADNFGATFPPGACPEDKVRAGGVVTAAAAGVGCDHHRRGGRGV
jgi:hypothetical protein